MLHIERMRIEEFEHVAMDSCRTGGDRVAVDSQKDIDYGERHPFVAVDERMVLNQTFHQRGSLVGDRLVVARLWPVKSGLERASVADAGRAAVTFDQ